MSTVASKDIAKIAQLAQLRFDETESEKLQESLSNILSWAEQLNEVNVENVEPLNSVFVEAMPMRDDLVTERDQSKALTCNAPEIHRHMFTVPKVLD